MKNINQPSLSGKVETTHLDKIFWRREKYTKGDLLNYYNNIGAVILPYLKGRPESLNRFPDGIGGVNFFQKNYNNKVPGFVDTVKIKLESGERSDRFLVCNNKDALLYLVNLGCIELNPWSSRVGSLRNPDYAVLDLDPGNVNFEKVAEVALAARKILEKLEIPSCVKTSGKTGMHIVMPLAAKYAYAQTRQFVEILASLVHKQLPALTSLERSPNKRKKQIYLDFLQNNIGQTIASAYSARPWPGATVSAPLKWQEVNKKLRPSQFTIKTIFNRLDKYGDLWAPVLGPGIDLDKILTRIQNRP